MAANIKSPSTPTPEPSAGNPITDALTTTITIDLTPPSDSKAKPAPAATATGRTHPEPPSSDADVIHIPSYSRWFSWNRVHECEVKFVPEFFDGRSPSKNPRVYKYYRNAIIRRFRESPTEKITVTEVRKTIVGDVGSIRRIFDFLEAWGLINYTGSSKLQLKWEEKESKPATATSQSGDAAGESGTNVTVSKSKPCSNCKGSCSFASDKHDMTLCARCYVRGNYRDSLEFKRVEISEEAKTDWTDKETLQFLEAIMHYGDDWKKVAEHVGGRSKKQCVNHFVNLPFGEQFDGPPESAELDAALSSQDLSRPTKRTCLTPLSDFSNPIMAQAAFLSTLVGVDVAEVAARASLAALTALGDIKLKESLTSGASKQQESDFASNGNDLNSMEGALSEAKLQLEKEDEELEKAISGIAVQTKECEDNIVQFKEFDFQMERKLQKLQKLQNLLFVDQFTFSFHKTPAPPKAGESVGEGVKVD